MTRRSWLSNVTWKSEDCLCLLPPSRPAILSLPSPFALSVSSVLVSEISFPWRRENEGIGHQSARSLDRQGLGGLQAKMALAGRPNYKVLDKGKWKLSDSPFVCAGHTVRLKATREYFEIAKPSLLLSLFSHPFSSLSPPLPPFLPSLCVTSPV